ncbi:hypothetical protein GX563_03775 [Candidatus Bathyarchaeota archaeon]|nr:hypothetical protein [Candidatus Bathyarchaeota archaeon]
MGRIWIIAKKVFSVSLLFNALLTIACAASVLGGVYWYYAPWKPFEPYIIDGAVFWFAIAAAVLSLYPSAMLGRKLHTGRFLFHHYFYGLVVIGCAAVYVVLFTPASIFTIFIVFNESVEVNLGKFFLLGGFALLLDDLPDVSMRIEGHLNWLKDKARRIPRLMGIAQAITGAGALYLSLSLLWGIINVPQWVTLANFITCFSTLITAIVSFVFIKRRFWHKLELKHPRENTH